MSNAAKTPQSLPGADYSSTLRDIRRLIYLYIFLLIIEGALRKWIVPQFSNPLLLVRDPVVLAIYFLTWRAHIFRATASFFGLPSSAFFPGSFHFRSRSLCPDVANSSRYGLGFRSNFLHLPLIFIFASVLDVDDVKKIGWWILLGIIPMSLLMACNSIPRPTHSSIAPSAWAKVNRSPLAAEKSDRPARFHSFPGRSITSPVRLPSSSTALFAGRLIPAGCFSEPVAAFFWQLLFRGVVRW